ncbi:TetR/AcrR family transcriptional regulator [Anoxynatronum buryatiense]|uniref:Transcriptional regulator, TetR family n=1 Tax=Anoxynatronum buryatiense TaxID=489973 RepID=A0AA45WVZ4_9CLOT|nr:TetR/AcrR family transcriptional regulator [Anoxynatronum buryatiense]SMP56519.1 transcriptional regulator, TetR family [Anoxynatronum buryatiense]
MPKKAFLDLPNQQQDVFFDQALILFAAKSYQEASLSSLLRNCGIPKGTFYTYFADKLDLYTYVVDTVLTIRSVYIKSRFIRQTDDFFQLFEAQLRLETAFRLEHPAFHHLLSLALDPRFTPFSPEKLKALESDLFKNYHALMVRDQLKGKIAADVDAHMITFICQLILKEFHFYVQRQMAIKKEAPGVAKEASFDYCELTAQGSRRLMALLRRGLSPQGR